MKSLNEVVKASDVEEVVLNIFLTVKVACKVPNDKEIIVVVVVTKERELIWLLNKGLQLQWLCTGRDQHHCSKGDSQIFALFALVPEDDDGGLDHGGCYLDHHYHSSWPRMPLPNI